MRSINLSLLFVVTCVFVGCGSNEDDEGDSKEVLKKYDEAIDAAKKRFEEELPQEQ